MMYAKDRECIVTRCREARYSLDRRGVHREWRVYLYLDGQLYDLVTIVLFDSEDFALVSMLFAARYESMYLIVIFPHGGLTLAD
jgi:hypothetical protein